MMALPIQQTLPTIFNFQRNTYIEGVYLALVTKYHTFAIHRVMLKMPNVL